jgi:hypothetical protein
LKELLIRLLGAIGLVPAGRYRSLVESTRVLRDRAEEWKQRAATAAARVKALEVQLKEHARDEARLQRKLERARGQSELIAQLADTERELLLAREHLMAIEVKLDILEGAANVLDLRTRAANRQSAGSGAAV